MKSKKTFTRNYMLHFKGWAQGRIPTDPDPSFEPRGVSGYTFSLPGEPDLDRVVYFQNKKGVVRRSHCPEVGVTVCGGYEFVTSGKGGEVEFVSKNMIDKNHPLFNARVDLLENGIFVSENSTVVYNGFGIINPFILSVEGKGISINRRFYADPKNPQTNLENYTMDTLNPFMFTTAFMDSVDMIYSANVLDRTAFRNERKRLLEADLAGLRKQAPDKNTLIQIAALEKRIAELNNNNPQNRRTNQIGTQALVSYPLNATEASVNSKKVAPPASWPLTMWLGGWDADSLCFFVNGYVQIILEE